VVKERRVGTVKLVEGEKLKAAWKLGPPMQRVLFSGIDGVQKDIMWV